MDSWRPVFAEISRLVPVLAYDRSGLGKSDDDGERPTQPHVAQTLHSRLDTVHVPPPYVLVVASWGGVYIRGFASLYPREVAGLVYLDVTDYERTADELASVIPASSRPATPSALQLPDSTPPGVRAELEQVREYGLTEFADIRAVRVPSGFPVAVLVGGMPPGPLPPTALTTNVNIFRLMLIRHQADWALSSPSGLLLVASQAGHNVMQDVPALVMQAIRHVLDHVAASR